eukprot:2998318-Prymnesium_polylepis.1
MVHTFERIASNVVRACPFYKDTGHAVQAAIMQSGGKLVDDDEDEDVQTGKMLHYPGAITTKRHSFEVYHLFKVFCCPHNEGATHVLKQLLHVAHPPKLLRVLQAAKFEVKLQQLAGRHE